MTGREASSTCGCLACTDPHGYYCPDCGPDDEVRCDGSRKPPTLTAEDVAFFRSTGYVPDHRRSDV